MNLLCEPRRADARAVPVLWCLGWANLLLSAILMAAMFSGVFPGAAP